VALETRRAVEIAVENPRGGWELASGFLLDGTYVLTTCHVLTFSQREVQPQRQALVRLAAPDEDYRPATLYWDGGEDNDFALLQLDDPLPGFPMVQWGDLVRPPTAGPSWSCTIVGFPYSASEPVPTVNRCWTRDMHT
jgi:hypothetical protein